jgi:hypothetical protein
VDTVFELLRQQVTLEPARAGKVLFHATLDHPLEVWYEGSKGLDRSSGRCKALRQKVCMCFRLLPNAELAEPEKIVRNAKSRGSKWSADPPTSDSEGTPSLYHQRATRTVD